MRGLWLLPLVLVLLSGTTLGQPVSDPAKTNLILTIHATPQLAPGEQGDISLELRNPYAWAMENASLQVEVYAFVHRSELVNVSGLANPPSLGSLDSQNTSLEFPTLVAGARENRTVVVRTSAETPGGTPFTQGTYLVRFRLDFDYQGGLRAVMVSPGFYTPAEWAFATRDPMPEERAAYRYVGFANYSFLGQVLGLESVDGILSDAGFGVKDPLPLWPFQLLAVGAGISFALALYVAWRGRETPGKP